MRIIATAPTRISLAGGGTDVDPYRKLYGGCVINMAINIYQHVELGTHDDMWAMSQKIPDDPTLFYKILTIYDRDGMHKACVQSYFDGIIGAGLGSSGSAAVALIGALRKEQNKPMDREYVAYQAFDIEVNKLKWYGGRQDQYAAAYGGLNLIEFGKDDDTAITPFSMYEAERLKEWMVLFYVGKRQTTSGKIQQNFKKLSKQQIAFLDLMKKRVDGIGYLIQDCNFKAFGKAIDELWQYKKESNKNVSNSNIDDIYSFALKHGAVGGKIMGAGSGGYMVFICNPNKQENLIKKMAKRGIEDIDFSICYNGLNVRRL